MCGIFSCIKSRKDLELLKYFFTKIKHRGPDSSCFIKVNDNVILGFHRLAIVDTSENGNQPFIHNGNYLICNGEIFNHKELEQQHNLNPEMHSRSDCECILHMYEHFDIDRIVKSLDAEFVFVIYDEQKELIYAARDPFGVRPLFIGFSNIENTGFTEMYFSSEIKAINFCDYVTPFLPGHYLKIDITKEITKDILNNYICFYSYPNKIIFNERENVLLNIKELLIRAVTKRTMSDRTVGCLLSGGLDSSLVASILSKLMPSIHFFSIGLEDGIDINASKRVIEFLQIPETHHHIVNFTVEEGLNMLEEVIEQLETYDITTIRASTPQYLLAKYISTKTPVIVLYSGEGSDELFAGYQYSKMAPSAQLLLEDSKSLLHELYMFDNLRTDRTTAKWGLEVRVPFLDKELVSYVLSVNPEFKMCNTEMEKKLLRDAFKGWLPDDILYRPKAAFSDAVSSKKVSWYKSLQELINTKISDQDLLNHKYTINPPKTKEALYYRNIFDKYYPNRDNLISRYWMPQWVSKELTDPSATVLACNVTE